MDAGTARIAAAIRRVTGIGPALAAFVCLACTALVVSCGAGGTPAAPGARSGARRPAAPGAPPEGSASTLDIETLAAAAARRPNDAAAVFALADALARAGRLDEALAQFERSIGLEPGDLRSGNEYRRACARAGAQQRAIDFLEKKAADHPDVMALRLNLALAYVDKMPAQGLGIVGQGLLSNRSIRELNVVLDHQPASWPAIYGRAMNHLHWPRALRHSPQAIADFHACLKLQADVPRERLRPHHLLPWLGLGDAQVKDGRTDEARRTWKEAQSLFPDDPRLAKRLAMDDEGLRAFVEDERGLARPIDTDLSFVWSE